MTVRVVGLLVVLLALQVPEPPPYCVNHENLKYPRTEATACTCKRPCKQGEAEDPTCRKWCSLSDCKCLRGCET